MLGGFCGAKNPRKLHRKNSQNPPFSLDLTNCWVGWGVGKLVGNYTGKILQTHHFCLDLTNCRVSHVVVGFRCAQPNLHLKPSELSSEESGFE